MCTHKRFYEVKCLYINLYKTTIARNQTCAWGLSEFLPMGWPPAMLSVPKCYQNRDIRFFKYVLSCDDT